MSAGSLVTFVRDSNRIEGIHRDPTRQEIEAHTELLALDTLSIEAVETFVSRIQPDAKLRRRAGLSVRVGPHRAARGGPQIERELAELLTLICNTVGGNGALLPWKAHVEYETLHPFSDGNGRSGRALWAWQMLREGRDPFAIDVLRALYYQSLDWGRGRL